MPVQKIRTFLWFNGQAEEAAHFYVSLFTNSSVDQVNRYSEAGPGPAGSAMTVVFRLAGIEFIALNGGPHFQFTEAISLSVDCESQEEVDRLWERLSQGGERSRCGWLKDQYGLSWQIVPGVLSEYLAAGDAAKSQRVMAALMTMTKIDIQALSRAYHGS